MEVVAFITFDFASEKNKTTSHENQITSEVNETTSEKNPIFKQRIGRGGNTFSPPPQVLNLC